MHTLTTLLAAVAFAGLPSGCGGTDISGSWSDASGSTRMTLNQDDDDVTGSGTRGSNREVVAFAVSGTAKDDDVDLTIKRGNVSDERYQAKLDGDTMNGTWGGLVSIVVTLHRQ